MEEYNKKVTGYANKKVESATEKDTNTDKPITGLVDTSAKDKPNKIQLKVQREKDREPVRGVFKYHENQGGVIKFSIKLHKEDQVETYELVDGGIYTLPRGVATHLNKNTFYPVYEHSRIAKEASGLPELKVKQKIFRTGFYPLDFVDVGEGEQQAGLVTVETRGSEKHPYTGGF